MVSSLYLSVSLRISMTFEVGGLYYEQADASNSQFKRGKSDIQRPGREILLQPPLFVGGKGFKILHEKKNKTLHNQ